MHMHMYCGLKARTVALVLAFMLVEFSGLEIIPSALCLLALGGLQKRAPSRSACRM